MQMQQLARAKVPGLPDVIHVVGAALKLPTGVDAGKTCNGAYNLVRGVDGEPTYLTMHTNATLI